jgi:uncharacterized protein (DUF302 family)
MNNLLIEKKSPFGVDRTVELIVTEAELRNWRIPVVHDLQQTLSKAGKVVMPVKVIELCKPEFSGKMLELNQERAISVMMPCRISVYEKEDGKAYVALMNTAMFAASLPETLSETMVNAAEESMLIVDSALES